MMEHKAYILDYSSFDRELRPVLETALQTMKNDELVQFIESNLGVLKDPCEGELLDADWRQIIDVTDVHQLGDLALTKYYDPKDDLGIGNSWEVIQDMISEDHSESPVLGVTVGPTENPFDPGKMGSYFQSEVQVDKNYRYLDSLPEERDEVKRAKEILSAARNAKSGLYVTF